MRHSNNILTTQEYRNAIYFDFEGEGKSRDSSVSPKPKICGFFRPNEKGKSGKFKVACFDPQWKPVVNGNRDSCYISSFNDCFYQVLIELDKNDKYLIHWTEHEREVLKTYLDYDIYEILETYLYNLHPVTQKYVRVTNKFGDKSRGRGRKLEDFYAFIYPSREAQPSLSYGAAESCRKINKVSSKKKLWRSFSDQEKKIAHDLINYNHGDCRSAWLIAKRLSSYFNK